jgi:hypothetical protein
MNNKDKEFELVKYLRNLSEKESDRFWTRNNVFVTINAGLLAFLASSYSSLDRIMIMFICVFGVIISAAWLQISRTGKFYAQRWRNASRELAQQNDYIIEKAPILAGVKKTKEPRGPSSSRCMKWLAIISVMIWLLIGIYSIQKNTDKTDKSHKAVNQKI